MTSEPLGPILRDRLPYLVLAAIVLGLDRWTKSLVQAHLTVAGSRTIIDGVFDLVYFRNTGVAFGLFDRGESPLRLILLSAFALAAALAVAGYSLRSRAGDRLLQSALSLILAGALGNLYDRVTAGYVTDFLYFHIGPFDWPAFNVADTAISLGVALMAIEILRHELPGRA